MEIKAERNIFGQLVLLSEDNNISIERALTYPLGPVPWALATADGSPMKTDKAKLLHHLEGEISRSERPNLSQVSYIYDGNALSQSLTNLPNTFEELAEKVFTALPKTERIDVVTDTCKENAITNAERSRRGNSKKLLFSGSKTRIPRDWKGLLSNNENKTQLIKLIQSEWCKPKYANLLFNRRIFYVCGEECVCISSSDGINVTCTPQMDLFFAQEEADTRIILHLNHASNDVKEDVSLIIRSVLGQNPPRTKSPWYKILPDKIPLDKIPPLYSIYNIPLPPKL